MNKTLQNYAKKHMQENDNHKVRVYGNYTECETCGDHAHFYQDGNVVQHNKSYSILNYVEVGTVDNESKPNLYVLYREFGTDLEIIGGSISLSTVKGFAYQTMISALNRYDDEGDDETAGFDLSPDGLVYTISVGDCVIERFVIEKTKYLGRKGINA